MRKIKSFKIDDKELTVKELRVRDILQILNGTDGDVDIISQLESLMPKIVDGLSFEELIDFAPSEIRQIVEVMKEVNDDFLALSRRLGLDNVLKEFVEAITKDFSKLLADSLEKVILMSSTTDTPPSLQQ
jgi:formylmethanofuran dehydrogenase subunit B